jgi:hypothetical protein
MTDSTDAFDTGMALRHEMFGPGGASAALAQASVSPRRCRRP